MIEIASVISGSVVMSVAIIGTCYMFVKTLDFFKTYIGTMTDHLSQASEQVSTLLDLAEEADGDIITKMQSGEFDEDDEDEF